MTYLLWTSATIQHASPLAKLSIDSGKIRKEENKKMLHTYHVVSFLGHLSTNTFRINLKPEAIEVSI